MIKDKYAYNSIEIAKYIIVTARKKRISINITKLQKLMYICYGTWLALKQYRLTEEKPQAWQYGPLFFNTWEKLYSIKFDEIQEDVKLSGDENENKEFQNLLDVVLDKFGDWNATMLVNWTHKDESPWSQAKKSPNFKWGDELCDNAIYKYFSASLKKA